MNLISMLMLFANYCDYCILDDGRSFLIGVAYWGRLYGIHTDPNYGSVLSVIALISGIYFCITSEKMWMRILKLISVALQAMFIIFSVSRTGLVTTCVCTFIFSFIYSLHGKKKIIYACIVSMIAVIAVVIVDKGVIMSYNYAIIQIVEAENDKDSSEKEEIVKIGREEELQEDVSNRRFELWKNAIEITKTSPVVGVSFGNFISYAKKNLPGCYMVSNGFTVFNAFHNMFMDLIASQGIIGFIMFIGIMIASLCYLIRYYKNISEKNKLACIFLFSACSSIVVSSLFVSQILFVNNQITVLFWILWGFLIYFVKKGE